MQSVPVSPPPMTMTSLPSADSGGVAPLEERPRALGQVLHREVDPGQAAALDRQVARHRRAGGEEQRVVLFPESPHVHRPVVAAGDHRAGDELDALRAQQVHAPLHGPLVELHVRDAVHQQPANPVFALVHGDPVARRIELRGRRQTRGAGPDDGDAPAGSRRGRIRHDPALGEAAVDDGHLDVLDGHRRVGDAEDAGPFAWSRAHAPGELGEVVGLVQAVERLAPPAVVHEVVPLGDQVVDRAAVVGLAERDAAVHAPRPLCGETGVVVRGVDLVEVEQALRGIPIGRRLAHELLESGCLAHGRWSGGRHSGRRFSD